MQNQFTVVVSHFVKPGKEEAFEHALKQALEKAKTYKGYAGIQTLEMHGQAENEYILLIRFDTEANYQIWAASDTRKEWAQEIKQFITRQSQVRFEEGLEFWFSMPSVTHAKAPKKWKMALLTWMVIYPSVLLLSTLAGIYLNFLPLFARMIVVTVTLITLMTYFIMPNLTKAFAFWIYDKS